MPDSENHRETGATKYPAKTVLTVLAGRGWQQEAQERDWTDAPG